jgi:hypothetical protein
MQAIASSSTSIQGQTRRIDCRDYIWSGDQLRQALAELHCEGGTGEAAIDQEKAP